MEDGYQRGQETHSSLASTQPTVPRETLIEDDDELQAKEREVPPKEPVGPLWTMTRQEDMRSTDGPCGQQQLFEGVVKVKPECVHVIGDPGV